MYAIGSNSAKLSGPNSGRCSAAAAASRKLKRAQILLAADAGASDEEIARSVGVGGSTVYRTKRRFVEGNLSGAERRAASRSGRNSRARKKPCWWHRLRQSPGGSCPLDARAAGRRDAQAHRTQEPVARDGSAAPGRKWPQALAQRHVVHPQVDGETSPAWRTSSTSTPRRPIPSGRWVLRRSPCTHRRGTSPIPPGRSARRTTTVSSQWYGQSLRSSRRLVPGARSKSPSGERQKIRPMQRDLVDIHYPDAEIIRSQDNLSTHSAGALYQRPPPKPAILRSPLHSQHAALTHNLPSPPTHPPPTPHTPTPATHNTPHPTPTPGLRPATLQDLRKALMDRGLVRNYGDRWAVNYES